MIKTYNAPKLLAYGISTETWTKRFGVLPFSYPCIDCGEVLHTSIPFVQGDLRGLQAPPCICGNTQTPFAIVRDPRIGDLLDQ